MTLKTSQFGMMPNINTMIQYASYAISAPEYKSLPKNEFIKEFSTLVNEYINAEKGVVRFKLNAEKIFSGTKIIEAAKNLFGFKARSS